MPLAGTHAVLGTALKGAVDEAVAANQQVGEAQRTAIFTGMARVIIEHIIANAAVSGPVSVTSVSGVTPGPGVSGPGAGSLTGGTIA